MTFYQNTLEYKAINSFYKKRRASRSGTLLINHINEGCLLLQKWRRPEIEVGAFCLHPLIQNYRNVPITPSLDLAKEYGRVAAKYLCMPDTDYIQDETDLQHVLGNMSEGCAWLLLADKVQNQKDFRTYHWFTHDRRHQLEAYFNLWIKTLHSYYI